MNRSGADAECLGRLENSRGRQMLADALDDILADRTTPEALPLAPRPRETGFDALDNHRALELGKDAHHLKHRLSGWCAGVDTLLMEVEINALGVQFVE